MLYQAKSREKDDTINLQIIDIERQNLEIKRLTDLSESLKAENIKIKGAIRYLRDL